MNTPKYQHLADSSNIQAIYESWSEIKRAEEWALLCSTKKDWQNVIRICQSRQQLVNQHFDKHPVCPETAFFYHRHLSEHFRNEELMKQVRSMAVKNSVRLIKN